MKNDLTCGVVHDLLPSYVEGILGEESKQAVDRHLADCPECAAVLAAMQVPEPDAEEQFREVDYLKRVKKHSNRRIAAAVFCTALLLCSGFLLKIFVIGTPLQPQSVGVTQAVVKDGVLHLSVLSTGSANAFHGWKVETQNGIASVYARDVLVSPLFSQGGGDLEIPLEGVTEVWLGGASGRLVWQDGIVISTLALDLLDVQSSSDGIPTKLEKIADLLHIQERTGPFTIRKESLWLPDELMRAKGWTLDFPKRLDGDELSLTTCYNILTLALVDELEASLFTHLVPEDDPDPTQSVTAGMYRKGLNLVVLPGLVEEYNQSNGTHWKPKDSIKDYAASPADLQRLLIILDSFYHVGLTG